MSYRIRFTKAAREDLLRLYALQLERDVDAAQRAREAIGRSLVLLRELPFACRKATADNPFLREMIIPYGNAGYVALFEIEDQQTVTVLAIRHQLEEDYH